LLDDVAAARQGLHDILLAALDAPPYLHLPLARQQRDGPHLAQVHPHRVVGLLERTWGLIVLGLLGLLLLGGRGLLLELGLVLLLRVDHLDAERVEQEEHVVEVFRGVDLLGQHVVDLVVEQVPPLPAEVDQLPYLFVFLFDTQGSSPLQDSDEAWRSASIRLLSSSFRRERSSFSSDIPAVSSRFWMSPNCRFSRDSRRPMRHARPSSRVAGG